MTSHLFYRANRLAFCARVVFACFPVCVCVCVCVWVHEHAQSLSCILLICNLIDSTPPCSSVHGISQARILEWVAISFSRGSSQSRNQTHISCIGRRTLYHKGSSVFAYVKNKNSQTTKCVSSFESLIAPSMACLSLALCLTLAGSLWI